MGLRWHSSSASDVGRKRKINEDALLSRDEDGLWLVADGMGGHDAGDVASKAVVHAFRQVRFAGSLTDRLDLFEDTLIDLNLQLRHYAQQSLRGRTMGTTVVAMLAFQNWALCLWVGDSRLYQYRHGRLRQVSRDHSVWQEMLDQGMNESQLQKQADLRSVITRAVGGHPRLVMDTQLMDVQAGDRFLLCTDGLYRELDDEECARILIEEDTDQACQILLQQALERGGHDNISLILVDVVVPV